MAESEEPALILGESGSGKEIISRFIHCLSKRREKPFYPMNCSSEHEKDILYSKLFGHEKGAYTGAIEKRRGLLKSADGGTVFLDEIQSSSENFQCSLLRFLDFREIQPLGSDRIERADVRIISASSLSLEELKNSLYLPLFYRIEGLELTILPLREREDKEAYIYYFLLKECKRLGMEKEISEPAMEALKRYPWPGNLREMRKVIHSAVLLSKGKTIEIEDLPEKMKNEEKEQSIPLELTPFLSKKGLSMDSILSFNKKEQMDDPTLNNAIRTHIQKVLSLTKGNKSKAAKILGIPLTTLISKMKRLGIE
ncbi:MAG: sigma 54-interacting transcriptional regulator [candidate division WOR-3 bacterium]